MRVYLRISLLCLTFYVSRRPVLVVRFFLLLFWFFFNSSLDLFFFVSLEKSFSLVVFLLFDFMALHVRRAAVCKFAGSRFALVVPFLRCRGLVSNWMFTGESIHQ